MEKVAVGDGRFQWSVCLVLLLQAAAAEVSQLVREGGRAVLTCGNLREDVEKCGSTTWMFASEAGTLELVTLGTVNPNQKSRISLSESCSLVIPEVRGEDVGRYYCQQFGSGVKLEPDPHVYLSVVTLRRVRNVDQVSLSCSVMTFQGCSFQLTWLFNKVPVVESGSLKISTSSCKATVETLTSHYYDQSREKFLTCEIQNKLDQRVQWFSFGASGQVTAAAATTAAAAATVSPRRDSATLRDIFWGFLTDFWWIFVIAAAAFVAVLVTVVIVLKRKRTKATRMNNNDGKTRGTNSSPGMSPDMVDAEDSVFYSSITIQSQGKVQIKIKNGDGEGDGVIYTTVQTSPSYPSNLSIPTI